VSGVVTGIAPYGAFVDTEDGAAGLIHISKMSHEQISAVGDVFKVRNACHPHHAVQTTHGVWGCARYASH
jgi:predicted RNA-binding protein with RPS1 domain